VNTLTLSPVPSVCAKRAATEVANYRESNRTSNRTNWARVVNTLAAVLTVIKTGDSVEVTDLYPASDGAPLYNLAHRVLSVGAIRPYWDSVRIVVLKSATDAGKSVTGEPSSTTKVGRVFICPVE
jgi:hypothetical protein